MKDKKNFYETIEDQKSLAEITLELGRIIREKYANRETLHVILDKEEKLLKQIAELTRKIDED